MAYVVEPCFKGLLILFFDFRDAYIASETEFTAFFVRIAV
jgi:hypothetical protein